MDRQSRIIRYIFLLLLVSFIGAGAGAGAVDKVVVTSGRAVYDAFGIANIGNDKGVYFQIQNNENHINR